MRIAEYIVKAHISRDRTIVEKDINVFAISQETSIGTGGIDLTTTYFQPLGDGLVICRDRAAAFGLRWSKNGKFNSFCNQSFQCCVINGCFCQPHSFGIAPKPGTEVGFTPTDLGVFVPLVGEGQDDVIVDLSDRIAVTI